jgi:hypothetical protein
VVSNVPKDDLVRHSPALGFFGLHYAHTMINGMLSIMSPRIVNRATKEVVIANLKFMRGVFYTPMCSFTQAQRFENSGMFTRKHGELSFTNVTHKLLVGIIAVVGCVCVLCLCLFCFVTQ